MPINWPEDPARKFNFRQIMRTRPSGGLLSSLGYGQPWLIQRAVSPAELHLPKHHFPPEMDTVAFAARGGLTLLITNFDDGFCSLTKFPRVRAAHVQLELMASTACKLAFTSHQRSELISKMHLGVCVQEELEDMNMMWLFPQSMRDDVMRLAGEIYQRRPKRDGPVFVYKAAMLDRTGAQLQVMGRWQAFYNEEGEYAWCVVIFDHWVVLGHEIPLWPVTPPSLPPSHQHQQQHQPPPDLPLFELVSTDWV
jgi:hypothetical protein